MGDRWMTMARRGLRRAGAVGRTAARGIPQGCRGWLAGSVPFALGAVLDFLAEDGCALCRKPHEPRSPSDAPAAEPVRFLLAAVTVGRLFGTLKAVNHPVCRACAAEFVVAHSTGVLGRADGSKRIETALGETFGAVRGRVTAADAPVSGEPVNLPEEEEAAESSEGEIVRIIAPFMTTDAALKVIHLLKFGGYPELALPVARAAGWAIRRSEGAQWDGAAVLVPTPMDPRSLKRRGFNHAERIARALSAELGWPVAAGVLLKRPGARMQSRTRREDRARNVRDAFWCPPSSAAELAGKKAILVDDLVTTGATAAACGAALLQGGAGSVTVVCFGRAM